MDSYFDKRVVKIDLNPFIILHSENGLAKVSFCVFRPTFRKWSILAEHREKSLETETPDTHVHGCGEVYLPKSIYLIFDI